MSNKRNSYRVYVGENGNEIGHLVRTGKYTLIGVKRILTKELSAYKGDGWGYITIKRESGEWEQI